MKKILTVFIVFFQFVALSQNSPFDVYLEPMNISGLGGLQSFAVGQHNGKWLVVGGRLDGLHRRQPWATFDIAGHNNQLLVIDPLTQQKWSAPLSTLSVALSEQLSSTNMEFIQEGEYLYIVGGYGYSATLGDHTTFDKLTAVHLPAAIDAVINNTTLTPHIRQISDPSFQVTGGRLKKINNIFYLCGGQKFIGRYNPMGPNNGPGFVQEYTNAIRKFTLQDDGTTLTGTHLPAYIDAANLHRRDYNAEAQILPDGSEGITMFSGVFQPTADLPFLNAVNIDSATYTVNNAFQQYYNHYHCAVMPVYAAGANQMHTVFFGGIAQYFDSAGMLVQDNNVPFVKTIARVTRNANGVMSEYKLPVEMPALLGAGAEFIPHKAVPHYKNEVFKLDEINADTTLMGYIYGGISSTAANIFWINDGTQSTAASQLFKVFLVKDKAASIHDLNEQSIGTLKMAVYPNPNDGVFEVKYQLQKPDDVTIKLTTISGKVIENTTFTRQYAGENTYRKKIARLEKGGIYLLTIETSTERATQKIIIEP